MNKSDLSVLQEWRFAYLAVCNVLRSFYLIAGEPELAKKIRPTQRRASGKLSIDDPGPSDVEPPTIPVESPEI